MPKETKEVVNEMTDFVNSFGSKNEEFCELMAREHRTLQQSFTRLCLKWLETVGSDEYRTDGRNEGSKKIVNQLLNGFKEIQIAEGFSGETLEMMSKPSGHLGYV